MLTFQLLLLLLVHSFLQCIRLQYFNIAAAAAIIAAAKVGDAPAANAATTIANVGNAVAAAITGATASLVKTNIALVVVPIPTFNTISHLVP